ncbi:MAG: IS200/IS605 family transposase [Gemmataceae bacterium]|nr:IS200/IS605 family transposase [Gemmataceae bacterium]
MPQSHARVLVHLVFSTKYRQRCLTSTVGTELHSYMAATLTNNNCPSLRVGGVEDHVHALFGMSRTHSLAEIVELMKTASSKWIKTRGREFDQFHWQNGYGAFSVSSSRADEVIRYIEHQPEHHRAQSFQDEYRLLLQKHGIEFDERYVWD